MLSFYRFYDVVYSKKGFIVTLLFIMTSFIYCDPLVARYAFSQHFGTHWPVLSWLSVLGSNALYLSGLPLLILLGLFYYKDKRIAMFFGVLLSGLILTQCACLVLKIFFGRARPELYLMDLQYGFYWFKFQSDFWSFPSGHTMTVMSLAWSLSFLLRKYWTLWMLIGVVVALTRILLVKHYPSDVIAGFYISGWMIGWFMQKCETLYQFFRVCKIFTVRK